jgi:hypothetical protein
VVCQGWKEYLDKPPTTALKMARIGMMQKDWANNGMPRIWAGPLKRRGAPVGSLL